MKKKYFLYLLLLIFLFSTTTYSENNIEYFQNKNLNIITNNKWNTYTNNLKIQSLFPNNDSAKFITFLTRDERYIDKYNTALENKNNKNIIKYYPSNYIVTIQHYERKIDKQILQNNIKDIKKTLKNNPFNVLQESQVKNKNGEKGYYILYNYKDIIYLNFFYGIGNHLISITGSSTKYNKKAISLIYLAGTNFDFNL